LALIDFLIFALSIIFLYKLLSERFQKQYISLLGCFIYVFSPRFLAESFYNPKDLPLLSLFVIAGYLGFKILKGANYKYAIGLGLVMGLATALRIVGIFLPLIFGGAIVLKHFFTQEKDLVQKLKMLASMLIVYLLTFYIAFPYLWTNPIGHFIEVFENLSKYPLNAPVLFEGQYYTAPDLPRYYALIWIVITTPIPFLLLALIGVVVTLKQWITEYRNPLTYINLFF
jgi:dolichyl-phosphate-mannose--protein O-mannosyl transferase